MWSCGKQHSWLRGEKRRAVSEIRGREVLAVQKGPLDCSWGRIRLQWESGERTDSLLGESSDSTRGMGTFFFFLVEWLNFETGCPERLWSLHPWGYSESNWAQSWATGSSWAYLQQGPGLDDLQRLLRTSALLWLCGHFQGIVKKMELLLFSLQDIQFY